MTPPPAASVVAWPIVERYDLFAQVAGAERGCVLIGPAGAGKTTTARIAARPPDDDTDPVVITGVAGLSSIPLGALSMAEMTAPRRGPDGRGDDEVDLVSQVRLWLDALRRSGVRVVIDDPAALDAESVTLLADALRDGLVPIVTHRPTQPPPSPLAEVIDELALPQVEIEPLDASMIALAVEQAVGRGLGEDATQQLAALSGGNPMFLREIVRDLSARDAWTEHGGELHLRVGAITPSARLADLFRTRLPDDAAAGELLQLVAHAGSMPVQLARALAPPDVLDQLERDGWLAIGETASIPHPLMAQVVMDGLDGPGTRRLLQRAVDTVTAAGPVDELDATSRLRVLRWALAGDSELTADELRWGRAESGRRFDRDLACLIADRLATIEPTLDTVLEQALVLAQAGRYDEVILVLISASEQVKDRGAVIEIARFLLRFAGPFARLKRWGDPPSGLDRLAAAWADDALSTTACTSLLEAMQSLADGNLPGAREQAEVVRRGPVDGLHGDADEVSLLASMYSGNLAPALAAYDRLHERLADPAYRHPTAIVIDAAASSLLMLSGRFEDAYDFDRRIRSVARSTQDHDRAREMSGHLGMTSLFVGQVDDAIEAFDRYLDHPAPPTSLRTMYTAGLAQAHALAARLEDADRLLAIAEREADVVSAMMQPDYDNLVGMVLHLLGHVEAGEIRTRVGMRVAGDWLNTRSQLMGLLSLARSERVTDEDLVFVQEVVPRAANAAPAFGRGIGVLVAASHARDPDGMDEAAEIFDSTGFVLGVAEARAAACRATTDRRSRAYAIRLAALDAALARCPGLRGATVLVERSIEPLTDREREIATLAAGGLANQVIAERLAISHRTVENTLHRTFSKLGVSSRAELADAMSPAPTA